LASLQILDIYHPIFVQNTFSEVGIDLLLYIPSLVSFIHFYNG